MNLLLNACDASQRGDQVEVRARTAEGRMVLEVTDQGKGIPEALAERVMEPFFTTKPQGQGTGPRRQGRCCAEITRVAFPRPAPGPVLRAQGSSPGPAPTGFARSNGWAEQDCSRPL